MIIAVDYFTRFLCAKATPDSQGKSAVALLMEIVKRFGWPRAVYTDNGAHFVSGEFANVLKRLSVVHLPAPKSHPQSVGLAERYVKLLVDGLKVTIMGRKMEQTDWDLVIDSVIHAINTRVLSIHGFTPAELLLGFNPNKTGWDVNPNTERAVATLSCAIEAGQNLWDGEEELAQRQLERLARIDHIREEAAIQMTEEAERREAQQKPLRHIPPKEGDLVLLRRFLLDQRRGSKLEARWEGPYVLSDLAYHGKTGRLLDFNTGEVVRVKKGALRDRVHLNDLKIYLQRKDKTVAGIEELDILEYEQNEAERQQEETCMTSHVQGTFRYVQWIEKAKGIG